jgi:hypothetical protein
MITLLLGNRTDAIEILKLTVTILAALQVMLTGMRWTRKNLPALRRVSLRQVPALYSPKVVMAVCSQSQLSSGTSASELSPGPPMTHSYRSVTYWTILTRDQELMAPYSLKDYTFG